MKAYVYMYCFEGGSWRAGFSISPEVDRLWLLDEGWRAAVCMKAGMSVLSGAARVLACKEEFPLGVAARAIWLWKDGFGGTGTGTGTGAGDQVGIGARAGTAISNERQAADKLLRCIEEAEQQKRREPRASRDLQQRMIRWERAGGAGERGIKDAEADGGMIGSQRAGGDYSDCSVSRMRLASGLPGAVELSRAACEAAAALRGRALLRGEAHALLGANAAATGSCDAALQLAALLGLLRLGSAVAAEASRRPRGSAALRCQRCGSGGAQLRRTDCASCGRSCAYCEACLAMGRSRECGLLVLGMPQHGRRGDEPAPPPQGLPPAADRLGRWGLSLAQSAAAAAALQFIEQPAPRGCCSIPADPAAAPMISDAGANPYDHQRRFPAVVAPFLAYIDKHLHRFSASSHTLPSFLIWAVTGAGKTEMVFPLIESVASRGGRVLLAAPRRDVILELNPRVRRAFPEHSVVSLYGGSPQRWDHGSITLATTHQLIRFREAFDLVIIDEIDAFPFAGDRLLNETAARCCRPGAPVMLLTATPGRLLRRMARDGRLPHAKVPVRYHRHPLPIPRRLGCPAVSRLLRDRPLPPRLMAALRRSLDRGAQVFVFVSRIRQVEPLAKRLAVLFPGIAVNGTHSQDANRTVKVQQFRDRVIRLLVTTTILERGVTVPRSDVFVLDAHERIFNEASLVQIAGRAGRSGDDPKGSVYFAAPEYTNAQAGAIRQIRSMNRLSRRSGYLLSRREAEQP